jgi:Zn-dependent M28 family amino/carboxypeptidase
MTDWIADTVTSSTGWDHLERLVDVGSRMAGSAGERRAAEATRDALADVGVRDTSLETFDIQGWTRGSAGIEAGDRAENCIALPRSPSGAVTGRLVDVGHGLPADFDEDLEGAIVMAASDVPDWHDRFVHRREKYYHAVEAGAAGFVFRNHVEGCLAPTGSVGTAADPIGAVPAVGVSKEVGARLCRRSAGERIRLSVDADAHDAESQNVHGDLGPDTEQAVLLTSHVDAHDISEGASDNAAGTALVLEVAKALSNREADLETRVHCLVFGAEEVGLVGSRHDADRRDHDTVAAVVNNDGVGRARTLECYTHGFPELDDTLDVVADRFDHPISTTPELGPHSDHWPYVQWGVPGVFVGSDTGSDDRGWGHTRADTLDKLEPRTLREHALLVTELVVHLAREDVSVRHRGPDDIAAQLEAEDLAAGMQVIGDWPY